MDFDLISHMRFILARSRLGLLHIDFCKFITRVMVLDVLSLTSEFRFAQYLENKLMDFDEISHMYLYWQDIRKSFKWYLKSGSSLGTQTYGVELGLVVVSCQMSGA